MRKWRTPTPLIGLLIVALTLALITVVVLAVMLAREPRPQAATLISDQQRPPIVDVEGLKQRTLMMDKLVQYFTALNTGDDGTVYSMSCKIVQQGYDSDQRAGLKKSVVTMTKDRGPAHVQIPTSIDQPTENSGTVETVIFYEHAVAALSGKSSEKVRVSLQKEDDDWRICSVASL